MMIWSVDVEWEHLEMDHMSSETYNMANTLQCTYLTGNSKANNTTTPWKAIPVIGILSRWVKTSSNTKTYRSSIFHNATMQCSSIGERINKLFGVYTTQRGKKWSTYRDRTWVILKTCWGSKLDPKECILDESICIKSKRK